jgi:acetoin utilization protein AcuB
MQVKQIMTRDPIAIGVNTSVGRAWEMLHELDVRHLPVVDASNELVGIVSDRDFGRPPGRRLLNDVAASPSLHMDAPVATIMTSTPESIGQHADLRAAAHLMVASKVGALPVLDEQRHLVGIVSYLDLLRALAPGPSVERR